MLPPSGRQVLLDAWGQRAVVVEVGGGLRTYEAGGIPVLDGYGEEERCSAGRGEALLPWPNRLADGRYEFDGLSEQAPLDEPDEHNAIHGLTRWLAWEVVEAASDRAVMGCRLRPRPGWAWTLDLRITYQLGPEGLRVMVGARNPGSRRCPWGAGFHPYLAAPTGRVDDIELSVPASTTYELDERGLPVGRRPVGEAGVDFREPALIGERVLDHCYTDLRRDPDGVARVVARDPGDGGSVAVHLGLAWSHVMVFSGDTVGERAREGLAVEPMTCPPNALRTGDSLLAVEPGASWEGSFAIVPSWLS